jgi:hypothetical protein
MLKALRHRWEVRFRHECFVGAIAAADYRNAHRRDSDRIWSPLDYVTGEETSDPRREQAKQNIAAVYQMLGTMTPEAAERQKAKVIADLKKQGFEDAEEMFAEIFDR